jgi:O-acetyl-ADP-ribose deacetylase (regulator of RNase III)
MRITLVDLHGGLAEAAREHGWQRDIVLRPWTDIRDCLREAVCENAAGNRTAFVSPANSLGFMDGGIDYVLSREMFPGVEAAVKAAYAQQKHVTLLGRTYLPIGRAVVVETQVLGVHLISAPTMWLPQDVRGTHNAYHAMYAILRAATESAIDHVILCGLCTGYGKMDADTAVVQMKAAHDDFLRAVPPRFTPEEIVAEQPGYYANTEWKRIDPQHVRLA